MKSLYESPILFSTIMLAVSAVFAAMILRFTRVKSLRLQTLLIVAVLLQGVMLFRLPVQLKVLPPFATTDAIDMEPSTNGVKSGRSNFQKAISQDSDITGSFPDGMTNGSLSASPLVTEAWSTKSIDWSRTLFYFWFSGAVLLAAIATVRYARLVRLIRRLGIASESWQSEWGETLFDRGIATTKCPMLVSKTAGPMVVRTPLRSVFIVPSDYWRELSPIARRSVMIHEAEHLARRDIWRMLFAQLIATLHWFNPFSWWAAKRLHETAELACDHAVARRGAEYSAGFAGALITLVSNENSPPVNTFRSAACLSMASPPLKQRISNLLQPTPSSRDNLMNKTFFVVVSIAIALASCIQIHLTADDSAAGESQTNEQKERNVRLQVISQQHAEQIEQFVASLDTSDDYTAKFAELTETDGGKLAISSYLDQLRGLSSRAARSDAIGNYVEAKFDKTEDGLAVKEPSVTQRWRKSVDRLNETIKSVDDVSAELIAEIKNDKSESAMLLTRFLKDPQSSVALLLTEMDSAGDPIAALVSKALDRILVQRPDGKYQVVASAKNEAAKHINRFKLAERLAQALERQLPVFAAELDADDKSNKRIIESMNKSMTAYIIALHLSEKTNANPAELVESVFESLESACVETAGGLRLPDGEARDQIEEILDKADHVEGAGERIHERLLEIADAMAEDEMSQAVAGMMRSEGLAVLMASEIPYTESMAGDQFRAHLDQVLESDENGNLKIRSERSEELSSKLKELLKTCRQIRRHATSVDALLEKFSDRKLANDLSDTGRYLLINEIRRHAESHRADVMRLLKTDLVKEVENGKLRVRQEKHELVEQLVRAAKDLDATAKVDDF